MSFVDCCRKCFHIALCAIGAMFAFAIIPYLLVLGFAIMALLGFFYYLTLGALALVGYIFSIEGLQDTFKNTLQPFGKKIKAWLNRVRQNIGSNNCRQK